jgi:hypothetical protein
VLLATGVRVDAAVAFEASAVALAPPLENALDTKRATATRGAKTAPIAAPTIPPIAATTVMSGASATPTTGIL